MADNNQANEPAPLRGLEIFLGYAPKDRIVVHNLYNRLCDEGADPWIDEQAVHPGHDRYSVIQKVLKNVDVVLICLSRRSINKIATLNILNKEIRFVINELRKQLENKILIIPLKMEECDMPNQLRYLQAIEMFRREGYEHLLDVLRRHAKDIGANQRTIVLPSHLSTMAVPLPIQGQSIANPTIQPIFADAFNSKEGSGDTGDTADTPHFEISLNIHHDKRIGLLNKPEINIGRDDSNDIVIKEPIVSAFHFRVVREGDQLVLIHPHPQASNGQTVNGLIYQGRHIQGTEPFRKLLTRGDIFHIGGEHGTVITLTYKDASSSLPNDSSSLPPQSISLDASVITIGSMPDNTVVLSHPQVSSHHARFERVAPIYLFQSIGYGQQTRKIQLPGEDHIIDLGSTNHVYVNDQRIINQVLKVGDEIHIGPFKFRYTGTHLIQQSED